MHHLQSDCAEDNILINGLRLKMIFYISYPNMPGYRVALLAPKCCTIASYLILRPLYVLIVLAGIIQAIMSSVGSIKADACRIVDTQAGRFDAPIPASRYEERLRTGVSMQGVVIEEGAHGRFQTAHEPARRRAQCTLWR